MFPWKKKPNLNPSDDPTALCNLLVVIGWVSKDQIENALQRKCEKLIGQTLIEMHLITQEQLDEVLQQQQVLRHEITPKQATLATLERQSVQTSKLVQSLNEFKDQITETTAHTGKLHPISRSTK